MKRVLSLLTLAAVAVLVIAALPVYAQGGEGEHEQTGDPALYGAALYAEFCQACHGPQGESIAEGPAFTAITFEEEAALTALEEGVTGEDGVFMPAYASVLGEEGMHNVLAYMATWGTGETPALPEPNLPEGEELAGASLYAKSCYGCHAAEGAGRDAEGFPALHWGADSLEIASAGGELGAGHAFGAANGGPLSDEQLAEIDAYAATWGEAPHAAEPESNEIKGLNVLIIMSGVVAILIVGAAYGTNIIRTES